MQRGIDRRNFSSDARPAFLALLLLRIVQFPEVAFSNEFFEHLDPLSFQVRHQCNLQWVLFSDEL
jgi:hypothetical protein